MCVTVNINGYHHSQKLQLEGKPLHCKNTSVKYEKAFQKAFVALQKWSTFKPTVPSQIFLSEVKC